MVGPARHWKLWATVDMSPLGVRCTDRAEGPPVIDITFAGDLERLYDVPHYPPGYEWLPDACDACEGRGKRAPNGDTPPR